MGYIQRWVKGTWEWKDGICTAMSERDLGMERWDIYTAMGERDLGM